MAVGVMLIAASRTRPGVKQASQGPSPGPAAPSPLGTGSGFPAKMSQGFGIPHAQWMCSVVLNDQHQRQDQYPQ